MDNLSAIDIETEKISYEHPIPEVICMSHAGDVGQGVGLTEAEFGGKFAKFLETGAMIVGHNIAFDLSLLCCQYPELWKPVFKAFVENRIFDTMLRERLLMLTTNGDFNVLYTKQGMERIEGYKLVHLEKKYLGIDRSDDKTNPDAWRCRYAELKGIPVKDWPKEAVDYSLADSVNCLAICEAQEITRKNTIGETGIDPFCVEHHLAKRAFALRLLECRGEKVDPEMIREITRQYTEDYNSPELVDPLIKTGLLVPGHGPVPYARGVKNHVIDCIHNKDHAEYKVGRKQKCDCPPKMKDATKDKMSTITLHQYMWSQAYKELGIEVWPAQKCKGLNSREMLDGKRFSQEFINSTNGVLPAKITLQADEEWMESFAYKDTLLQKYVQRKKLAKICTDYLPKFYQENGEPAETLRCAFFPLKKTGRCSSKAPMFEGKLTYPGRNGQNVDPRVRPCTVARDGMVIISSDYSGMELATLAQLCLKLFGKSVLADKINKGVDVHAFLAAQIAVNMDVGFRAAIQKSRWAVEDRDEVFKAFSKCEGSDIICNKVVPFTVDAIITQYNAEHDDKHGDTVTWGEFFKFYRRFAKPAGLGYPGGLEPPTMVTYAKGTYKINLTLDIARQLRQIWLNTYPEMGQYLLYVKNHCRDPQHAAKYEKKDGQKRLQTFYCYDTPLGLHRARANFCACANGMGLQSPSAEGALAALYETQKLIWTAEEGDLMYGCFPINFIHDEILWESPDDDKVDLRIATVDKIMVEEMEKITPDVKARTNSVVMRRWYKEAEAVFNDKGNIIPWEPEKETI